MDRETLKAVHDEKFQTFLKNINVYDGIIRGVYKCKFCGKNVNLDNIYTIFPEASKVKFVCDAPNCVVELCEYLSEKEEWI